MSFLSQSTLIDLTHPLDSSIPTWSGACGFELKPLRTFEDSGYCEQAIYMRGGAGTHMDAPLHFAHNGLSVLDLPLQTFFINIHVIDVSKKAHADYHVGLDDLNNYESTFGKIEPQSLVLVHTGWSKFWNNSKQYRNEDTSGNKFFPDLTAEFAQTLLDRNTCGVGVDTLSPDSHDTSFPVHRLLLNNNKYIIENLTNLHKLPPKGAQLAFLPLAIPNAAESPIRAIGIISN